VERPDVSQIFAPPFRAPRHVSHCIPTFPIAEF
jgi:hypothetical protein